MAKPRIPNIRKKNLEHKQRTERYATLIQRLFDTMAQEVAKSASLVDANHEKPFSFNDYPETKTAFKKMQSELVTGINSVIMQGTSEEWRQSNIVQDLVAQRALSVYTGKSSQGEEFSRYFQSNPEHLKVFQSRKVNGMNLSQRVWKLTEQYKEELEMGLSVGIEEGTSAIELAARLKRYLRDPDKLFRRVRDEFGQLHLSKNAKAYHPGRGVYRSSARNAQRLARTEINMAFRRAEQTRWRQFDFVVGYEIKTTQNGSHVADICDELAGKYPKDFHFDGWHPHCRCYCIPILKTEEEYLNYDEDNPQQSENEVTELPDNFKRWVNDNSDRIEAAEERGTLPYFIRNNQTAVKNVIFPQIEAEKSKKTTLEIANERHALRTQEREEYLRRWARNHSGYIKYNADANYYDVEFNPENGGLKATHILHNIDSEKGWYETFVQNQGYKAGHFVVLESEFSSVLYKKFTEGLWDGLKFELATRETATDNNILRGLTHCADKKETQIAVLYFPNGGFTIDKIQRAIRRYKGYEKLTERTFVNFKRVICITNDGIVYDAPF